MLGSIINRDYKTSKSLGQNLRDLFAFELMERGYLLAPIPHIKKEKEVEASKDFSNLPMVLRRSTGEFLHEQLTNDRFLVEEEIPFLMENYRADYFVQGVISKQRDEKNLEKNEFHFLFLKIYDSQGQLFVMLQTSLEDSVLKEKTLLSQLAFSLVQNLDDKLNRKSK